MDRLVALRRVLDASSDAENPDAEALEDLFHRIRTIAVVGISRDPAKIARRVPSYLAAKGYDILPVNPNASRILGRDVAASLSDITDPVDAVVIFRPSAQAGSFVLEAMGRPERPVIWLQEGIRADQEIGSARSEGRMAVQDLCTYKVHRAL